MSLGGAEKVFYQHIHEFSKRYNVIVCLFTKKNFNPHFAIDNEIIELDDKITSNVVKRWWYRKKKLELIIKEQKIDVCISHMEGPNFLNSILSVNCKKILVAHGSVSTNPQKSKLNKLISNNFLIPVLYNRCNYIVSVSEVMTIEHIKLGIKKNKAITINNFFEAADIIHKAEEPTDFDTIFNTFDVLVTVGRLAPQKNQKLMLDIFAYLKENGRKEKLLIIGDGPLKNNLIKHSESLGLNVSELNNNILHDNTDIIFAGAQHNPFKYVAKSKAFLLTSNNEGFPLVLGEAMACGTPIVSIDCPTGPREMLSAPGTVFKDTVDNYANLYCGNLVNYSAADLNIWHEAIVDILDNSEKFHQLKGNCQHKALEYDKKTILQKWYDII